MATFRQLLLALLITLVASSRALAVCGDVDATGVITAVDALVTLDAAVGILGAIDCSCAECVDAAVARAPGYCADLDADAQITATDALAVLRQATGLPTARSCSCDACSASAITTTTTLPVCLEDGALDGLIFNRKSRCAERIDFVCVQTLVADVIQFNHVGAGTYEVRSVPDAALLHVGTLTCTQFTGGTFQEFVTWTFQGDATFSGHSFRCRDTGAESPGTPPDPPPLRCGLEP